MIKATTKDSNYLYCNATVVSVLLGHCVVSHIAFLLGDKCCQCSDTRDKPEMGIKFFGCICALWVSNELMSGAACW